MLTLIKKRKIIVLFLILIFFVFTHRAFAMVKPKPEFYVNDYANILSSDTKSYIIQTGKSLQKQTGAQIVVVTIPNLEGGALEDYSTTLFRNFKIGDKTKNNGILILVALEERVFRIEVGYGLEGVLPDGKVGRIRDNYMSPELKKNNFDSGIKNGYNAILKEVSSYYSVDVGGEEAIMNGEEIDIATLKYIPVLAVTSLVFGLIISSLSNKKKITGKQKSVFIIIYLLIYLVITILIAPNTSVIFIYIMFGLFPLLATLKSNNSKFNGRNSGFWGGSSGGFGGRWKFWRRRFFWWWWVFWKLLEYNLYSIISNKKIKSFNIFILKLFYIIYVIYYCIFILLLQNKYQLLHLVCLEVKHL